MIPARDVLWGKAALAALLVAAPMSVAAEYASQTNAARALERAGFHAFEERRHEVQVDGCTMTTFVFEDWGAHEKVLWSSFRFDMRFATIDGPDDEAIWSASSEDPSQNLVVVSFRMHAGSTARHEMAMRRNPPPPHRPSPRKGVDSYIYKDKTGFYILQMGHLTPEQPNRFVQRFNAYRRDFCQLLG